MDTVMPAEAAGMVRLSCLNFDTQDGQVRFRSGTGHTDDDDGFINRSPPDTKVSQSP